jgi:hypothetical protein
MKLIVDVVLGPVGEEKNRGSVKNVAVRGLSIFTGKKELELSGLVDRFVD